MKKQQVLSRLCMLCFEVSEKVYEMQSAADCFCGSNSLQDNPYQFDAKILHFIEKAVRKEIENYES